MHFLNLVCKTNKIGRSMSAKLRKSTKTIVIQIKNILRKEEALNI